jgi:hypothetical protein
MMMKMLEAGGQSILTDNLREADANNPKGYYEFERVKQMKDGDLVWLSDAVGKVVKIVTGLIMFLPSGYNYKIIFMRRDLNEILSSQKKMLGRLGKEDDNIPDDKMAKVYEEHLKEVRGWLIRQPNIETLYVNYNSMVKDPTEALNKINDFLGGGIGHKFQESSCAIIVNFGPFGCVNGHDVVNIQQGIIAFNQNVQLKFILVREIGRTVGQNVCAFLGSNGQSCAHALTRLKIPGGFCGGGVKLSFLPNAKFLCAGTGLVRAGGECCFSRGNGFEGICGTKVFDLGGISGGTNDDEIIVHDQGAILAPAVAHECYFSRR